MHDLGTQNLELKAQNLRQRKHLDKFEGLPCRGPFEGVIDDYPEELQDEYRALWQPLVDNLMQVSTFPANLDIKDPCKDILYCYNTYVEPVIHHDKQEEYWDAKSSDLESMANNIRFSENDKA